MNKLTLRDLSLKGERVLMRVDFNVPQNKDGSISDDSRIKAAIPSIEYILKQGASLVLMSHLGRPKAKPDPQFSLAPCAKRLGELLGKNVLFASDCVGAQVEQMTQKLKSGEILLLENLRFHPGEEEPEKEPHFAEQLAHLGTVYVNDAFGTAHRAHSSTALIAHYFPQKSAAGFLMEKELTHLSPLLHNPKRPFFAIIGGAKVSTKAGVIENLLECVDALFIGGGMVFPFMKAKGIEIGSSLFDPKDLPVVEKILANPKAKALHFPIDLVIADAFSNEAHKKTIALAEGIPTGWQGMDIGAQTIARWSSELAIGKVIFWNGPVGVFEMPHFATGTQKLAQMLAQSSAEVIVGGGDSVAAIQQMGLSNQFSHLSTGGGASLELIEYGHLPGIDALSDKK